MASLADLLAYKQKQAEMLNSLPKEPTLGQRLENLSYAAGEGFSDQLRGLQQLVLHPVQSAKDIYAGVKTAVQNPRQALQAASEGIKQAASSPEAATRFIAQNFSPVDLANALNKVGTMRELTVYHGTPHKFEPTPDNPLGEFTASKIGTGEGAASYGHGIYLAQNPKVAEAYKERLTANKYTKDDKYVNADQIWSNAFVSALDASKAHPDRVANVVAEIKNWVEDGEDVNDFLRHSRVSPELRPAYEAAIKEYQGSTKNLGHKYTVDLPDEKIDQMLDWDKPLSEQPHVIKALANTDDEFSAYRQQLSPKFQKIVDDMVSGKLPVHGDEAMKSWEALQRAYPNLDHNAIHDVRYRIFPNTSEGDWLHSVLSGSAAPGSGVKGGGGADLYNLLGGGAEASAKLRAAGIPGIKYLDEGSRATGLTPHYDLVRKKDGAVVWQVTEGGNALEQARKMAASGDFELKGPTDKRTRNFVVFPGEEKNLKILSRE